MYTPISAYVFCLMLGITLCDKNTYINAIYLKLYMAFKVSIMVTSEGPEFDTDDFVLTHN